MRVGILGKIILGILAPLCLVGGAVIVYIHPKFRIVEEIGHMLIMGALVLCVVAWVFIWRNMVAQDKKKRRERGRPIDMDR